MPLRRPLPRTLRGRLIAGLVALLAVACATVGLVTYLAVQGALSRELSNQLQTATTLAYNCWRDNDNSSPGQHDPAGAGAATSSASPAAWTSAMRATGPASSPATPVPGDCNGVGEGTFVAIVTQAGQCYPLVVGHTSVTLTAADKENLRGIAPSPGPPGSSDQTVTRYLGAGKGTYLLTAVLGANGSV